MSKLRLSRRSEATSPTSSVLDLAMENTTLTERPSASELTPPLVLPKDKETVLLLWNFELCFLVE